MTFKNVLWTYKPKNDGTCNVKIYVYDPSWTSPKHYKTDIYVLPNEWNESKCLVKNHHLEKLYNAKIKEKRNEIETHFLNGGTIRSYEMKALGFSLIDLGKKVINERQIEDEKKGIIKLAENTLKGYRTTVKHLTAYATYLGVNDISFDSVTFKFYRNFRNFLIAETGAKKPNGYGKYIKNLIRLMKYGQFLELHSNEAYKKFVADKGGEENKTYLTKEETTLLENLDLTFNKTLERERDRWLIQFYFLFRYVDITTKLKKESVFKNDDGFFLRIFHQKTKNEVVIPIGARAEELLLKYDFDFNFSSNVESNRHIKTICALAGINAPWWMEEVCHPKSMVVENHTARRSGATQMFLDGVSLAIIAKIGGWKTEKSLRSYLRASGLDIAIAAQHLDHFK